MAIDLSPASILPGDAGLLIGRVWQPAANGPSVVRIDGGQVLDITAAFPTIADILNAPGGAASVRSADGTPLGSIDPRGGPSALRTDAAPPGAFRMSAIVGKAAVMSRT